MTLLNENCMTDAANALHSKLKLERVELLLHKGAAISAQEDNGSTALQTAADKGDQKMIPLLLSKGADPSCVDKLGRKPLQHSVRGGAKTTSDRRCGVAQRGSWRWKWVYKVQSKL